MLVVCVYVCSVCVYMYVVCVCVCVCVCARTHARTCLFVVHGCDLSTSTGLLQFAV